MEPNRVIFVSAVSNEFHNCPPELRHGFHSYRDVLKQAFRTLAPHYEVVIQEDLVQGPGDLLETLDMEVQRSLVVVHLIGDLAGYRPEPACLRQLHQRHPDLLGAAPELRSALPDETAISYTQWEIYLAFHHQKPRLIFEAEPAAARSPKFVPDAAERASQEKHRERLAATGAHRSSILNQGDVARKTMRSFLHFHMDPTVDDYHPQPEALDEAWRHQEKIVDELTAAIKKPDPRMVPVTDPANVAAFVAAVRVCAQRWQVNLATIVSIVARHEETVRAAAESRPTPDTLYDQALAELALGDFTAAMHTSRRSADVALELRQRQPEDANFHREAAINALLLFRDAASAAHEKSMVISALEEAGALVDKEKEPLLWAGIHEPLAEFLLEQGHYDRADELVNDLVDIREQYQPDNHPELAGTLLLWCQLLHVQAKFEGMRTVAARAEHVFASQIPANLPGIASALRAFP